MAQEKIELEFPDGSTSTYEAGITGYEVAESISKGLAREALSVTLNGSIYDLDLPLPEGGKIKINTWDEEDGKYTFWHSSAHILAEAVQALYPDAKFGIGPPIDRGFYYDIDFGDRQIGQEELEQIEEKCYEMARKKSEFHRKKATRQEAIDYYRDVGNEYKIDLIEDFDEDEEITFYTQGEFTDLCRGPHIPHTGRVKAIKLTNLAGAYWRGDETSEQLTRIYGISFPKQKLLEAYIERRKEAERRDHKKLGPQLGIYMIDTEMVGSGLPIWLPNGTVMRRNLEQFMREELKKRDYREVITPHIGNIKLYETSGHYPYYQDSQFSPMEVEDQKYLLKPMNCPHHHRIYDRELRSYRDLPLRLAEFGSVYRYEQSGELNGLSRVRGFTQDDAHIYCTHDQLKQEIKDCLDLTQHVFKVFDMPVDIRLSFRDENEEKYGGKSEFWDRAEQEIREVAEEEELTYHVAYGEASFYGPKIDFIIQDAIGRSWQLGTVQVDYVMPERFDLTYVGADNERHRPVIIHRAPFGSLERFMSILIEHFAGNFPVWLAPTQVRVIAVSDEHNDYARQTADQLRSHDIRVDTDLRSEKIGSKIRDAETSKIPYMLIVGGDEASEGTVSVRRHQQGDLGTFRFEDFLNRILQEIEQKSLPPDDNSENE